MDAPHKQTFVTNHPYYPRNVEIPNYMYNTTPVWVLVAGLGGIIFHVLLFGLRIARRKNRNLALGDQVTICWFLMCGFLHCCFESYFVLNHATIAESQNLFAQLWKEYALSDSRYMTSDPFVLCIEVITVLIWGPLCLVVAYCITHDSPLRHPLQIITCMGHFYGVVLYYGTCQAEQYFRGVSHSRPEFLYFWVYYVGCNAPWVLVPLALIISSSRAIKLKLRVNAAMVRVLHGSEFVKRDIGGVLPEKTKQR